MRWTLDRYHKMIEGGFFDAGDRVELLFGKLVDVSPVGIDHRRTVNKMMRFLTANFPAEQYYVDVQNPVTLTDDSEPEPDLYVAVGPGDRYIKHHPYSQDILLVIEVADTTLRHDRTAKKAAYAVAGIEEYWIINVYEKQVERFTQARPEEGTYGKQEVFEAGTTFSSLHLGEFRVDDLLV